MIPLLHRTKVNGSVISCTVAGDKVLVLDNLYHFYELDASDLSFSKSTQFFKEKDPRHKFTHAVSSSTKGFFFFACQGSSVGHVYEDDNSIKKIATLEWHKANISSSKFCRNGHYLATGGEDGKTFIFQLPSFKLTASLPPRPDYIASIVFDAKGDKLASSSFDGVVTIVDLERNHVIAVIEVGTVVEDGAFIEQGKKLFFACRDGRVGTYDLETEELIFQSLSKEWLTRLKLTADRKYAMIGTKSNILYVIRMEDLELLYTLVFEHNGISAIEVTFNRLILGYIDGSVEFYNLHKSLDIFENLINEDKLFDAIKLTKEDNVFLSLTPVYTTAIDKQWKLTLKEAIDLLATNRFKEAVDLVYPFMDDKRKKEEFSQYAQQIEAVSKFCDAWEVKDVQTAYRVAEQSPEVQKLPFYDLLEEYFLQLFNTAKKLLIMDANVNMPKAQALLKPFMTVKSKKDIVQSLLKDSKHFQQADNLLKERKFADFFALAERSPVLKQTNSYDKAMYMIPQVVDRVNQLMSNKNYEKAMELSIFLASLIPFKDIGEENIRLIEQQKVFLEAVQAKDIKRAYELALQELKLQAMPEYSDLNNQFREIAKDATNMAGDGHTSNVVEMLRPYFDVEYWKEKVASIIKVSYLYELDVAAQSKAAYPDVNWVKTVAVYLDRFGLDEEISHICEARGLLECLSGNKGNPKGYRTLPYSSTILIRDVDSASHSLQYSGGSVDIDTLLEEVQEDSSKG